MTKKILGRPHAPKQYEPVTETRDQEDIESTSGLTPTTATGITLRRGPLGFLRGAKAWIGASFRFRLRHRRGPR